MIHFPINPFFVKAGIIAALVVAAYVKGCSDEKERFDAYKSVVQAVGEAQEQRAKARIADDRRARIAADMAHDAAMADLRAAHRRHTDRLRREFDARSSVVPAVPGAAEGGADVLCFERGALDRGMGAALSQLLDATAGVLQRGDEARAVAATCAAWALERWQAR